MAASSRDDLAGAGWKCEKGSHERLMAGSRRRPFSWLSPRPLWESRNDRLSRRYDEDPINERRRSWVSQIGKDLHRPLSTGRGDSASFLVTGDTGEGDGSQYATVPPLRSQAEEADFLCICSDVIYPAGGIDEYEDKFCRPYSGLDLPVYAIPGNHDWYDDGSGFMYWFCGQATAPPAAKAPLFSKRWRLDRLWGRGPSSDPTPRKAAEALRPPPFLQANPQPGPYFVLDAGPVMVVGIDTGIQGQLDQQQGEWLERVSRSSEKPKILLTGKPLFVDGEHRTSRIEGKGNTVNHIVEKREHNYVAVIGGDIHNYQRYPARLEDGRTLMCLVTGGGGAFMHETHTIPNLDGQPEVPVSEEDFRCYPLRGDSLSRFSQLYARKMRRVIGPLWKRLMIKPEVAAALMSERLGIPPTRKLGAVEITKRDRFAARVVFALHRRGRGPFHLPVSEWLDWNEPPMFKQFLRVDASEDQIRIRCFAATGCAPQESRPPVEDDLLASRGADGTWTWTLPTD